MSYPKDELPAPDAALTDPRSFELGRLWFADGVPEFTLRAGLWSDPAAWGMLLAELARHVAIHYEQRDGHDAGAALERLRTAFDAELDEG